MPYGHYTLRKATTYQCSKCPTTCNRLDNIRRHVRKHSGQTSTPTTVMYEIKEMSPEPALPKRPRPIPKKTPLSMRPYLNEPTSTNDYIYQQTLKPKQTPPTWRLIHTDDICTKKPTRRPSTNPMWPQTGPTNPPRSRRDEQTAIMQSKMFPVQTVA